MHSTWRLLTGAVVLLVGTACAPIQPGSAEELVIVETETGVMALDPNTWQTVFAAPRGVAAPDWSRYFTTRADGRGTRLLALDPASGAERAAVDLEGDLAVAAVSTSGRLAALSAPHPAGAHSWLPAGRERTAIVVVGPGGDRDVRRFDLAGNFEPEAFSSDERRLFLLEYLPAHAPDRYRVRQLDLASGEPGPVETRTKAANDEEMRGSGRMQVLAPDRRTLYTLYTKQPDHVHARDLVQAGGTGYPAVEQHAFVHVLSLAESWAYCLDLPHPFGMGPAAAHALTLAPDGRRLYVADRSTGSLAVADTESLQLVHVAPKQVQSDATAPDGPGAAVQVGPRGALYLGGGSEVVVVNATTLAAERRWSVPGPIVGLALSPDGQRLYLGLADRLAVLDAGTGRELGATPAPGLTGVRHTGRFAG